VTIAPFHRTLEQELFALLRGASLECLVCGEFVLQEQAAVRCPECGSVMRGSLESTVVQVEFGTQAG
jgi:Zn finger protein HypA/HybF involved in hydrogenase expression